MPVPEPDLKSKPSPNRSSRHGKVRFIIMHDTVGRYPGDLNWLTSAHSKVSSDFYIRRNGELWQLNPDPIHSKTWHAGKSTYQGFSNLNEYSVGIEMEHFQDADDWPPDQVNAAAHLVAYLVEQFDLDLASHPIVSHAEVARPSGRKRDPRNFPWNLF